MPITCPNGHVNDEGNRFCDQCGAPLTPPAEASNAAPANLPASAPASGGIICPTCGQENLPGTAFCENCGAQLPPPEPAAAPAAPAVPETPAPAVASTAGNTCPNCGFQNDPDNTFCEQCGAALGAAATSTPAVEAPVMDESGATAGAGPAAPDVVPDAAATPPPLEVPGGAQSQPATEAAQPPLATPTAEEVPATDGATPAPAAEAPPPPQPEPVTVAPVSEDTPAPAAVSAPAAAPAPAAAAPTLTCSNCGAQLPPNAKFCLNCGTRVEQPPQMVRPTHCQNCGTELPPNARFCLNCGTKVELVPADTIGAAQQPVEATYGEQAAAPVAAAEAASASAAAPAAPAPAAPLPTALDVAVERADSAAAPAEAAAAPPEAAPASAQPAEAPAPVPVAEAPAVPATTARTYDAAQAAPAAAPVPAVPAPATPAPAVPAPQAAVGTGGGPRLIGSDGASISLPPRNELVVGREDPISGIHPDIDLTPHGGEAGGVSRRHAVLRQQNGQWSVTDLDSTNYTRVDGNRIAPNTETPLHDGARLQFGRVEFEFRGQ